MQVVSVPIEKLPNVGVHKTSLELATKRLGEISILKLRESGLVNSVFNRPMGFSTPYEISDSILALFKILRKYAELTFPFASYARGGIVNSGTTAAEYFSVAFQFKERSTLYKNLTGPTADKDCSTSSVVAIRHYGVPAWVTRYVSRLNREIMRHKLPLWVAVSGTHYVADDSEYLAPGEEEKTVLVKVAFHVYFMAWKMNNEHFSHMTEINGKFGRSRKPDSVNLAYFLDVRSTGSMFNIDHDSASPYMIFFYLESFKQVLKSLYRKVDYVPTAYSVTPV